MLSLVQSSKSKIGEVATNKTANRVSHVRSLRIFFFSESSLLSVPISYFPYPISRSPFPMSVSHPEMPICKNHALTHSKNGRDFVDVEVICSFRPVEFDVYQRTSSSSFILPTLGPPDVILSGPLMGSGSGSSFIQAFSNMLVHFPLVPA